MLGRELPEVFEDRPLDSGWQDDWVLISVPSVEKAFDRIR
jgi:hypothetical protein